MNNEKKTMIKCYQIFQSIELSSFKMEPGLYHGNFNTHSFFFISNLKN